MSVRPSIRPSVRPSIHLSVHPGSSIGNDRVKKCKGEPYRYFLCILVRGSGVGMCMGIGHLSPPVRNYIVNPRTTSLVSLLILSPAHLPITSPFRLPFSAPTPTPAPRPSARKVTSFSTSKPFKEIQKVSRSLACFYDKNGDHRGLSAKLRSYDGWG